MTRETPIYLRVQPSVLLMLLLGVPKWTLPEAEKQLEEQTRMVSFAIPKGCETINALQSAHFFWDVFGIA